MMHHPSFVLKRVKRKIPPPNELYPVVKLLFDLYSPLLYANTGLPLFDHEYTRIAKNILKSIELGHVSDVINGPTLYREIGKDKNGLTKYVCFRGTSSVEGYHQVIIRKFSSINAGPRLADYFLADFRLYHNIEVGSKNREGIIHKSRYSPRVTQLTNMMGLYLGGNPVKDYSIRRIEKFPVDFAGQSVETFGITALSSPFLKSYDMNPSH